MLTDPIDWSICADLDCLITAVFNWQTLVGGLVAIGAAWYAGKVVRAQIKASAEHERIRYERQHNAIRSLLPLTLSGMSDYAHDCAADLMGMIAGLDILEVFDKTPRTSPPEVPRDIIEQVGNMIEATDDINVIRMLRKMVGEVQILNSRLSGLHVDLEMEPEGPHDAMRRNVDIYLLQCAVIYAQCSAMFEFARFEQESVPDHLPWEEVFSAFATLGIREQQYPDLFALCARLEAEGKSPES